MSHVLLVSTTLYLFQFLSFWISLSFLTEIVNMLTDQNELGLSFLVSSWPLCLLKAVNSSWFSSLTRSWWFSFSSLRNLVGCSGKGFCWSKFRLPPIRSKKGWLLAGGINPENASEALSTLRPTGIDVSSGICGPDGIQKDKLRIFSFMKAVNSVAYWVITMNTKCATMTLRNVTVHKPPIFHDFLRLIRMCLHWSPIRIQEFHVLWSQMDYF